MNALIRAAADLQSVCETHEWRFCFISGLAVLRWGEPRETIDVGLMLITGFGHESEFVSVLTQAFEPRIDDAAAAHQDLIVLKAFADRPKDWMDIEGVIIRHAPVLDWPYVRAQLAPLAELKDAPDLLERLERTRDRVNS